MIIQNPYELLKKGNAVSQCGQLQEQKYLIMNSTAAFKSNVHQYVNLWIVDYWKPVFFSEDLNNLSFHH